LEAHADQRVNSMPKLHPQIEAVLKAQAAAGLRPIEALTAEAARAQMEETARARKAEPLPVARVEEWMIPGAGGPIRLRLYWPKVMDADRLVPAIVYYHGGGHVIGSLDTHDFVARNLCAGIEALVASVDYRMGPGAQIPGRSRRQLRGARMGARERSKPPRRS
jgi:acetyl esterase